MVACPEFGNSPAGHCISLNTFMLRNFHAAIGVQPYVWHPTCYVRVETMTRRAAFAVLAASQA